MRVRMLGIRSGPQGTVRAGEEMEVSAAYGRELIKGRYAEEIAAAPVPEIATEKLAGIETAADPEPSRSPKRAPRWQRKS